MSLRDLNLSVLNSQASLEESELKLEEEKEISANIKKIQNSRNTLRGLQGKFPPNYSEKLFWIANLHIKRIVHHL